MDKNYKTLVAASHAAGPFRNGEGGCHARCGNGGICPGVPTAVWLNGLGPDVEPYSGKITNGEVRDNWLRGSHHVVALEPRLAQLAVEMRRRRRELRTLGRLFTEVVRTARPAR